MIAPQPRDQLAKILRIVEIEVLAPGDILLGDSTTEGRIPGIGCGWAVSLLALVAEKARTGMRRTAASARTLTLHHLRDRDLTTKLQRTLARLERGDEFNLLLDWNGLAAGFQEVEKLLEQE